MPSQTKSCSPARGSPARTDSSPKRKVYAYDSPARDSSRSPRPAPGAYEVNQHTMAVRSRKSHNKLVSQGMGNFMSKLNEDRSAPRFGEEGDPTAYSEYALEKASISATSRQTLNRRVQSGSIGFNTSAARCATTGCEEPLRGPGSYDFHHLYGCGETVRKATSASGSASFTSQSPLRGYIRKNDTPEGGAYDPERLKAGSVSKLGLSAFAGKTARCVSVIDETLDPTTYNVDHYSIQRELTNANKLLPPFNSSSRRL